MKRAAIGTLAGLGLGVVFASGCCCAGGKCADGTCAAGASVDTDHATRALMVVDESWGKVIGAKDLDGTMSYYSDDAVVYPAGMPVAEGKAAARDVWAMYMGDPAFTLSLKTKWADVDRCGEMGYTGGAYRLTFTGPDGNVVSDVGKYLCVWEKQADGSWKSTQDMWNSDAP